MLLYCCAPFVDEFATYMRYVRKLDFFEEPDYNYLRKLFRGLMEKNGWDYDWHFDWVDRLPDRVRRWALFTCTCDN